MKAVLYEAFGETPRLTNVKDPAPGNDGVVVQVMASGICRSDWHGWRGHDPDIHLPHVPGHELAGIVAAVGSGVERWQVGDRVTVPFVLGCGRCPQCHSGNQQVCERQFQPGFTHWGSFAEYVSLPRADENLVRFPQSLDFAAAASLGCRFATSFRAVVDQDIIDATGGGAHVSLDALGHPTTCFNSISCLRRRGKHVQVGLMLADASTPAVPMARVISHELELRGTHGMQAHRYDAMLAMVQSGTLSPQHLVSGTLTLSQSIPVLTNMARFENSGVSVITDFSA